MSLLNPNADFDDSKLQEIIYNDFDRGLQIITAKMEAQLNQIFLGREICSDTQQQLTSAVHQLFFEFGVHWNLEYKYYCSPITDPDNITTAYIVSIVFRKPYSFETQSITINVNP